MVVRRRALRVLAGAFAAMLAVTVLATPAGAHAEIRESVPPAGGTAPTGTEELSLTFISLDPAEPVVVSVLDPGDSELVAGEVVVDDTTALGTTVRVPVRPLREGLHVVQWRAMSSDGDGITGDVFEFDVEEPSSSGPGVWLLWIVVLAIPALLLLRSRIRKPTDGAATI